MNETDILAPAAVLVLWSLIVLLYLYFTRFAAFRKAGVAIRDAEPGRRYADIEKNMPPRINWPSHNYTHLMEQPTLYYAVVAIIAIAGGASPFNVALAWAYTGFRVAHSLWQIFVNRIPGRVRLFGLASICLIGLGIDAVRMTVF